MILPEVQQSVYDAIKSIGGDVRPYQVAHRLGAVQDNIGKPIAALVRKGLVDQVDRGLYRLADQAPRTLSTELGIPHKKAVTPVAAPQAELRRSPTQGQRHPASIILEVIAHAPNPREYAGVVQEIGKILA